MIEKYLSCFCGIIRLLYWRSVNFGANFPAVRLQLGKQRRVQTLALKKLRQNEVVPDVAGPGAAVLLQSRPQTPMSNHRRQLHHCSYLRYCQYAMITVSGSQTIWLNWMNQMAMSNHWQVRNFSRHRRYAKSREWWIRRPMKLFKVSYWNSIASQWTVEIITVRVWAPLPSVSSETTVCHCHSQRIIILFELQQKPRLYTYVSTNRTWRTNFNSHLNMLAQAHTNSSHTNVSTRHSFPLNEHLAIGNIW